MDQRSHIGRWGPRFLPGAPWARWAFLALLALAAVLRFWRFGAVPYTHDEISALVRVFPTLWETIQRGVIELDTHPPGVQMLEWAWTRLFGMGEPAVKLPFVLMSLAALLLLYRFAMAWTSEAPALLLTALMATLQYSVMYGQIARPYAAGLFTTALMADQLTRFLAFGRRRALVWTGVAALLSAYTHHFALMLAAIIGATGLLLVAREQRKAYLVMCGVAMLLYLPNLPVFFGQLALGGLGGWLAPPDKHWLTDYAWWTAHCSPLFVGLLLVLVVLALVRRVLFKGAAGPARWFLPLWGLLPLAIGLAYSLWREPVVQYSMLLFSFPYLVLALFAGLNGLGRGWSLGIAGLTAVVSVLTLVTERRHYELFYASKYEAMLREGMDVLEEHGINGAAVLIDTPDEVTGFYLRLWGIAPEEFPHVQLRGRDFTAGRLDSLLGILRGRVIAYGESNGAPPEQLARIQRHFPRLLMRNDLVEGQVFRLDDKPRGSSVTDHRSIASATPAMRHGGMWETSEDLRTVDTNAYASFGVQSMAHGAPLWDYTREFGVLLRIGLDTVVRHPQDRIEVIAEVAPGTDTRDVGLVLEMRRGDSTVFYRTDELDRARIVDGRATLIVAACPDDVRWRGGAMELRAYLHNRQRAPLGLLRMEAVLREGNPWRYGLFQPVPPRRAFTGP